MARAIGINHVALEVGDIDEALDVYGRILEFTLAGGDAGWPSSTWATSSWVRAGRLTSGRPIATTQR